MLWRDRLGDERKAIAAFERVMEIDGDNLDALTALKALYGSKNGQPSPARLSLHRREAPRSGRQELAARRQLMLEIAKLYEDQLSDAQLAFEWVSSSYNEPPTPRRSSSSTRRPSATGSSAADLIQILRGRARARQRRLRADRRLAEDRLDLRGQAGRRPPRLRDAARGAARRPGGARPLARPRAAGREHGRLAGAARGLRARRARASPSSASALEIAAPARRRARAAHE